MSADLHAYRTSPALAAALTERTAQLRAWREADPAAHLLARRAPQPSVDQILRDHDVPTSIGRPDLRRVRFRPALLEDGADWWITCTVALFQGDTHPHLTPVPLAVYYTVREAIEARRAAGVL